MIEGSPTMSETFMLPFFTWASELAHRTADYPSINKHSVFSLLAFMHISASERQVVS